MMFINEFWRFVVLSSPYILLGLIIASLVNGFFGSNNIKKLLGKESIKDVLWASLIGLPLPLCSCAVIPTAIILKKSGASNGATSSFLISTPESGVDSIALTYGVMDLPMVIFRVITTFFSSIIAGVLNIFFNNSNSHHNLTKYNPQQDKCCKNNSNKNMDKEIEKSFKQKLKKGFLYSFGDLVNDISVWLLFGLVAASIISYFVPDNFFDSLYTWQNRVFILLLGIPLYICASATTPIAASMVLKGLDPGSALLLLMVGPATNITNIIIIRKYIGDKGVIINIFSVIAIALLFSSLVNYFYTHFFQINFNISEHIHTEEQNIISTLSAIIILLLITKGIYIKKFHRK